jgi:hypothetical protein
VAPKRRRIFTLNDPYPLRISGELAAEIGFNESIVLLQIEYLVSISTNEREGRFWTYHSLDELREKFFPWWSRATIARTLKSLEERQLITIGNFNRAGFDRTQWYTLDFEGIATLTSIRVDTSISQNETWTSHAATSVSQDEPTIPETTSETTQRDRSNGTQPRRMLSRQDRATIEAMITDYAREFRDQAPLDSSVGRALNLYAESGLDLDRFLATMQEARAATQRASGSILAETDDGSGRKAKMAYWFATLEDLLRRAA